VYNNQSKYMKNLSSPIKLIDESFRTFFAKENIFYFISIYLIMVPFQIFSYFQESLVSSGNWSSLPYSFAIIAINILYFIAYLLTSVAGIVAVKRVVDKEKLDFKDTMTFAWKNLWGLFLLSALMFLIILGGMILLIIPGIIFSIWFTFSKFIYVDQGLGIKASLGKSRELFKGRFWSVYWRLFVIGIFFALFVGISMYLLSLIPFGIGSAIAVLAGAFFILPCYLLYREL
jgi:hypothetical protein